jgi:hypothetical protein
MWVPCCDTSDTCAPLRYLRGLALGSEERERARTAIQRLTVDEQEAAYIVAQQRVIVCAGQCDVSAHAATNTRLAAHYAAATEQREVQESAPPPMARCQRAPLPAANPRAASPDVTYAGPIGHHPVLGPRYQCHRCRKCFYTASRGGSVKSRAHCTGCEP